MRALTLVFASLLFILALVVQEPLAAPQSFSVPGSSLGYTCDTEDFGGDDYPGQRSCRCSGPKTGTDCQAMLDEVCGAPLPDQSAWTCSEFLDGKKECQCPWKQSRKIILDRRAIPAAGAVAPTQNNIPNIIFKRSPAIIAPNK